MTDNELIDLWEYVDGKKKIVDKCVYKPSYDDGNVKDIADTCISAVADGIIRCNWMERKAISFAWKHSKGFRYLIVTAISISFYGGQKIVLESIQDKLKK